MVKALSYLKMLGEKYQTSVPWLEKNLPTDRIKCYVRELRDNGNINTPETQYSLEILSETFFGREQIQAGLMEKN